MHTITPILIDASLKGLLILLLVVIITAAMRRGSAAARHLVWSAAIVAVLMMPALSYVLPGVPGLAVLPDGWESDVASEPAARAIVERDSWATEGRRPGRNGDWLDDQSSMAAGEPGEPGASAAQAGVSEVSPQGRGREAAADAVLDAAAPPEAERDWSGLRHLLPWIWFGGAMFALLPLVLGWVSLWQLARTTQPITGGSWQHLLRELCEQIGLRRKVVLLRSPCRTMPMTWGALAGMVPGMPAKVLIPEDAYDWSPERRRAVLLHELAHIQRRDCLTQLLTQLACAGYWFNPLVWYAAHRMLIERERACDDLVLTQATKASDYAQHLLDIATGPQTRMFAAHAGIAMARRSKLDGRVVAILDKHRNRRAMSRLGVALTITLIGAVAVPVACVQVAEPTAAEMDAQVDAQQEEHETEKTSQTPVQAAERFLQALREKDVQYLENAARMANTEMFSDWGRVLNKMHDEFDLRQWATGHVYTEDDWAIVAARIGAPGAAWEDAAIWLQRLDGQWQVRHVDDVGSGNLKQALARGREWMMAPKWGPVIERVIEPFGQSENDQRSFLDLDTGDQPMPEPDVHEAGPDDFTRWSEEAGIDLIRNQQQPTHEAYPLITHRLLAFPVDEGAWDQYHPQTLVQFFDDLAHLEPATVGVLDAKGDLPLTYRFKTRAGSVGVMQIADITDAGGVHVRYKLVEQQPGDEAQVEVMTGEAQDDVAEPVEAPVVEDSSPLATEPAERIADAKEPEPRRTYTTRRPDYSLRDEPMRVAPRTLEQQTPRPADAIVLGWPIRWWSSHWSSSQNTAAAALDMHEGHPRLTVTEPGKRKVWVKYLDMPIDAERYPIMVMRYRAERVANDSNRYVLYLDDSSGPDYGGLHAVKQSDLIDDGEVHTLSVDLRSLEPIDDLIGLAVALQAAEELDEPAVFELLDMRFESVEAQPVAEGAQVVQVRVQDETGQAIEGAQVTLNAERRNWARRVRTGADGLALLQLAPTEGGRQMFRVEAEGRLPAEMRELPVMDAGEPISILLEPAARYRGQVVDEQGQPLAGAVVRLRTGPNWVDERRNLWTRADGEALTDAQGRWESPPLARDPIGVAVQLAHPAYSSGPEPSASFVMPAQELIDGQAVLPIMPKQSRVTLELRDETGEPLRQEVAVLHEGQVVSSRTGSVTLSLPASSGAVLLLNSEGYAPTVVRLTATELADEQAHVVQLERGREMTLRLVDEQGEPVVSAAVAVRAWEGMPIRQPSPWLETDEQGRVNLSVHGEPVVTLMVRKHGHVQQRTQQIHMTGTQQTWIVPRDEPEPTTPAASEEPEVDDGRRPGYDPERIFRRISRVHKPSAQADRAVMDF